MHQIVAIFCLVFLFSSPLYAEKPAKIVRVADYLAVFDLEIVG